jgi:hypothetical protein
MEFHISMEVIVHPNKKINFFVDENNRMTYFEISYL